MAFGKCFPDFCLNCFRLSFFYLFFPTGELLLRTQKSCAQWKPLGSSVMQQILVPALGTRHVKAFFVVKAVKTLWWLDCLSILISTWCRFSVTCIRRYQQSTINFLCWFQVPYKIKDVEQDYDNYNQVPESPIGRDEEPHLYMVPKKYRKVGPNRISLSCKRMVDFYLIIICLLLLLRMKISFDFWNMWWRYLCARSGHN